MAFKPMPRGKAPAAKGKPAPKKASAKPAAKVAPKSKAKAKPKVKPPMPSMDDIMSTPIAGPKMGGADLGGGYTPPAPVKAAPMPMAGGRGRPF